MCIDVKNSTLYGRVRQVLAAAGMAVLASSLLSDARAQTPVVAAQPFVSGEEFRVMCTSNWGNMAYLEMYAACRAYVAAVADVLAGGQAVSTYRACFDQEVTKGRATEAVIAWMREHPDRKGLTAAQIAASALAQTYPCS